MNAVTIQPQKLPEIPSISSMDRRARSSKTSPMEIVTTLSEKDEFVSQTTTNDIHSIEVTQDIDHYTTGCQGDCSSSDHDDASPTECTVGNNDHEPHKKHKEMACVKQGNTVPGNALRKLDPRKLNLRLELFTNKARKKERQKLSKVKMEKDSSNADSSPANSSPQKDAIVKSDELQPDCDILSSITPKFVPEPSQKQSWLLRLFESQVGLYCSCGPILLNNQSFLVFKASSKESILVML